MRQFLAKLASRCWRQGHRVVYSPRVRRIVTCIDCATREKAFALIVHAEKWSTYCPGCGCHWGTFPPEPHEEDCLYLEWANLNGLAHRGVLLASQVEAGR